MDKMVRDARANAKLEQRRLNKATRAKIKALREKARAKKESITGKKVEKEEHEYENIGAAAYDRNGRPTAILREMNRWLTANDPYSRPNIDAGIVDSYGAVTGYGEEKNILLGKIPWVPVEDMDTYEEILKHAKGNGDTTNLNSGNRVATSDGVPLARLESVIDYVQSIEREDSTYRPNKYARPYEREDFSWGKLVKSLRTNLKMLRHGVDSAAGNAVDRAVERVVGKKYDADVVKGQRVQRDLIKYGPDVMFKLSEKNCASDSFQELMGSPRKPTLRSQVLYGDEYKNDKWDRPLPAKFNEREICLSPYAGKGRLAEQLHPDLYHHTGELVNTKELPRGPDNKPLPVTDIMRDMMFCAGAGFGKDGKTRCEATQSVKTPLNGADSRRSDKCEWVKRDSSQPGGGAYCKPKIIDSKTKQLNRMYGRSGGYVDEEWKQSKLAYARRKRYAGNRGDEVDSNRDERRYTKEVLDAIEAEELKRREADKLIKMRAGSGSDYSSSDSDFLERR